MGSQKCVKALVLGGRQRPAGLVEGVDGHPKINKNALFGRVINALRALMGSPNVQNC